MSPTPYIYPHRGSQAATRHHVPLSSFQHHALALCLFLSPGRRSHPSLLPFPSLSSREGPHSRGRNSQHLSCLLPPLIRSLGNNAAGPDALGPLPVIPEVPWTGCRKLPSCLVYTGISSSYFPPEQQAIPSLSSINRGSCRRFAREREREM